MGQSELTELAIGAGVLVVNTRFPRPAVIGPTNGSGGVLFMPTILAEGDSVLVHEWITGLRAKSQEVA